MRIALVAPFGLRAKGTTRARVLPLGRALARRGHAVAVFIPPYDSPEDSGAAWSDAGVEVRNVVLPRGAAGGALWHLRLAWRLLRAVRGWRPDVVHVFKPKGPSGLVGAALWLGRGGLSAGGRPALVVDADDWEGPGGWNDDPRAGYSRLQRRFFAWQERYGLAHADAWTVTSDCLRGRAIGFGAEAGRVFLLHNGVDAIGHRPSAVRHSPSAVRGSPCVLLYTRFAGVRVGDVVAIWERVRAEVPEARLTVVGRGLGGEEARLAQVPGVSVAGWVEPGELPDLFARMDVAIVPWADTPSNRARHSAKVLALMAAGLPIVACAVGELPATLGQAGVLVPPGDVDAFARAAVALLRDRPLAQQMGAAARERALAEFTWDRLAEAALAAYAAAGGGSGG